MTGNRSRAKVNKQVSAPEIRSGALSRLGDILPSHCWAKTKKDGRPGITVRDHCLNVGCVAEALAALFPAQLRHLLPRGAATLAALHDVGKMSPGFQVKCGSWLERYALTDRALQERWSMGEPDHAKISQVTVQKRLAGSRLYGWAAAVGAHHGRIKGQRVIVRELWEQERNLLADDLIAEFGELPDTPPDEAAIWMTAGLITVADWIGSNEEHFPQDAHWDMPERRQRAQTALERINWRRLGIQQRREFADLFPRTPQPNSLQTAVLEVAHEPGVYVIEGPMGYGKTEAALAACYQIIAAGRAGGLYFGLPTQLTSNRIHTRVQPFVERISTDPAAVRLAHGSSWLLGAEPPPEFHPASPHDREAIEHADTGRSWFASAKRALLTPFGVGTIDQALLGMVAAKHFFVRQFGLAGKVVVLDEVHTYDFYTGTLISALVKRLRELRCTTIVLSATLTEKRRRELLDVPDGQPLSTAYPLVSGAAASLIERECEPPPAKKVHIRTISRALPVGEALEHACRGECLLWIRNTVDEAQETYRALRDANSATGPSIALLHSRFPFFRREKLEDDWMERLGKGSAKRPAGCVLVSTQVAEQSVDIDADLLITDLAPTDMLLQRIGRLWRHERPARPCPRPEVWVHVPGSDGAALRRASKKELRDLLGKSGRVYAPYVLLRSLQEWRDRPAITLPEDVRKILEATYADHGADEPAGWRDLREELEKQQERMALLALNATAVWGNPALPDDENIQTRYSTCPTAQLLLARQITPLDGNSVRLHLLDSEIVTASSRDWDFSAAKAIHRNLVRMPRWAVANRLGGPPRWLDKHVSQATAVGLLQSDGSICWAGQGTPSGLAYDADQGVIINRKNIRSMAGEEHDESYD
ncbi:MAG: CRISPR-associated helicase Cas3' [Bryobacteraceae bacterium]|nr:CRISPR-associated helicase Cas3' [Bryobacteraceae bacterium]